MNQENLDYYWDESGRIVMTAAYHQKRGYCCGNGCRHCPFDYHNVLDQKRRDELRAEQDNLSDSQNS